MQSYMRKTSTWAFGLVSLALVSISCSLTEADPSDDFSMVLGHSPTVEVYRVMSDHEMSAILKDRLKKVPNDQIPKLAHHITNLCRFYRFDPVFVLALIDVESRFRAGAVSPAGAIGLMQLTPSTAYFIVHTLVPRAGFHGFEIEKFGESAIEDFHLSAELLKNPFINTTLGITYLSWLRDHYNGVTQYFIAAYYVGPSRMDELLSRKSFQPCQTKDYFQAVRKKIPYYRFYQRAKFKI